MKQDNRDNTKAWQTTNTGGTNYVGEIHFHEPEPNSPLTRQEYRNRQALLTKVKNFWVKGVLEKSLYNQVLIQLGLEEQLDAVANPWNVIVETEESSPQPLPEGTKVIDIFDQIGAGRTLLILGEPGAGKTTTLLELTRDLIARAEQDVNHLVPVIFNLSSWAVKRQKVADWLVEELNIKYQVPKKIGQPWLEQQQLLPLLDGLDEVKAEYREQCLDALNAFHQEYGSELVVCSRIKDYNALSNRLNFQSAVDIRSLTLEQVSHYLDSVSSNFTGLRALVKEDTALQELASSPLMLNIMVLAYEGVAWENLPRTEVVEERRQQLLNAYIEKMFERRGVSQRYSSVQTRRWLKWLAQRMVQESQTIFLIERIQPSWLRLGLQQWVYSAGVKLIIALVLFSTASLGAWFSQSLVFAVAVLISAILTSIIGGLGFYIQGNKNHLNALLSGGLLFILLFSINLELVISIVVLTLLIVLTLLEDFSNAAIQPITLLKIRFKEAKKEVNLSLIGGITVGLTVGFGLGLGGGKQSLIPGITMGLISSLGGTLLFILAFGLSGRLVGSDLKITTIPNQGIRQSATNAIVSTLFLGLASSFTIGLLLGPALLGVIAPAPGSNWLFAGLRVVYSLMFVVFLGTGSVGGLIHGGIACIQHFTLRLILYCNNYIPWNYARFLDYATEHIFLQKVGGGYIFIHRLLLEHFAQMEL